MLQTILGKSYDLNDKTERQRKLSLHAIEFLAAFGSAFRLSIQFLDVKRDLKQDLINTVDHILLANISYMNLHDVV